MSQEQYGSDWPKGSVISFSDEKYRIRENWGSSGVVEYLDGTFACGKFYWTFEGEQCQLISTPSEAN